MTDTDPDGPAMTDAGPDGSAMTDADPDGPVMTDAGPDGPAMTDANPALSRHANGRSDPAASPREDPGNMGRGRRGDAPGLPSARAIALADEPGRSEHGDRPVIRPTGAITRALRSPRLIAIASGKGGVGKTWFAITLAHALARQNCRVLLFDADLGLANVDVQLGLTPALDLADVIAGRASIAQAALRHPDGNFQILAGRSGSGMISGLAPATLDATLTGLRAATAHLDIVLLDLGAGLEHPVRRMAAFADTLLVLLTEEPTSLTDAYAVLKLHAADRPSGDARVIVNQAASPAAADRTYATLRRACTTFLGREPPLAGVVRRDERVREAIRRQALLLTRHPTCAAAADVTAIARTLLT
ncbi:MAG TPA: AAA family ATPase [Acetobacteraceae bacterium]|nr:AAA family ATPase [Acetobacteraceae bacterium]